MEKSELGKEITELFDGILNLCNSKSFPSVKAALLLARDHVMRTEILSNIEEPTLVKTLKE